MITRNRYGIFFRNPEYWASESSQIWVQRMATCVRRKSGNIQSCGQESSPRKVEGRIQHSWDVILHVAIRNRVEKYFSGLDPTFRNIIHHLEHEGYDRYENKIVDIELWSPPSWGLSPFSTFCRLAITQLNLSLAILLQRRPCRVKMSLIQSLLWGCSRGNYKPSVQSIQRVELAQVLKPHHVIQFYLNISELYEGV